MHYCGGSDSKIMYKIWNVYIAAMYIIMMTVCFNNTSTGIVKSHQVNTPESGPSKSPLSCI